MTPLRSRLATRQAGLLLLALLAPLPAPAQGVPVFDGTALGQMVAQLRQQVEDFKAQMEQLTTLKAQVETQLHQLDALKAQVAAITGSRGLSALLNGDVEQAARLAMGHNVNLMVREVTGGNFRVFEDGHLSPGVDPAAIATQLFSSVGLDPVELRARALSDNGEARAMATEAGSAVLLSVAAEDAHARANATATRVTELVAAIDAQPDIKAAIDLNTRVTAELGFQLVDMLRLEATAAHTAGTEAMLRARDRDAAFRFSVYGQGEAPDVPDTPAEGPQP